MYLQIDPPCPALCVVYDCCSSVSNCKPDCGEYVCCWYMCKAYHVLLLEVGVHTNHRDLRRGEGTYHGRHVAGAFRTICTTVSFIRWTVTI